MPTRTTRISLSGLDGAGKSHQISMLVAHLQPAAEVQVVWIPFKVWPERLLQRFPAPLRSRLGPARRSVSGTSGGSTPGRARQVAQTVLWTPVACAAAVSAGFSLRRRAAAGPGQVVVLDRYRLDSIVKLQYWYAEVPPKLLTRIVLALAPRPTIELLLRLPAEVAYARKAEQWSVRQLSRQAGLYDAAALHAGAVVLDGCLTPEVLAEQIRSHVGRVVKEGQHV